MQATPRDPNSQRFVPRCVRCHTLYCDAACQHAHWADGHKKKCKKIQRAGGAEQYHADKKAKEAADEAVVACAAEGVPQDAECFICKSSIEGKGIVRGCACRGTMGLAHLSCLVWQAEAAVKEKEDQGTGVGDEKWINCFDCGQHIHGAVQIALGWAAWKMYFPARIFHRRVAATPRLQRGYSEGGSRRRRGRDRYSAETGARLRYLRRDETDSVRLMAVSNLGNALNSQLNARYQEALPVLEASLRLVQNFWADEPRAIMVGRANLAMCYEMTGRVRDAIQMHRENYAHFSTAGGFADDYTIFAGLNLADSLRRGGHLEEAKTLCKELLHEAQSRGDGLFEPRLLITRILAEALIEDRDATREDGLEAEALLEDALGKSRRILGPRHGHTLETIVRLERVRKALADFPNRQSARDFVAGRHTA